MQREAQRTSRAVRRMNRHRGRVAMQGRPVACLAERRHARSRVDPWHDRTRADLRHQRKQHREQPGQMEPADRHRHLCRRFGGDWKDAAAG